MKYIKNPLIILAFGLSFLFFVPLPPEYMALKIVIALMVISYGISLGAFKNKKLQGSTYGSDTEYESRINEIEKKLEQLEAREKTESKEY